MGTKLLRRSATTVFAARFVVRMMGLAVVATVVLPQHLAYAADAAKARAKIVDLNKQALLSMEAKDFNTARDLLVKALKEGKQAGLDADKMTARTYLHLGAVLFVGYQDQAGAVQNFSLAKQIRPDIQLTPSIETPELRTVFELAVVEAEPTPEVEPAASPAPAQTRASRASAASRGEDTHGSSSSSSDDSEPDLPATFAAPLMCSVPEEAALGKDLSFRCAVKPGLKVAMVQFHYRPAGAETYQSLAMKKTPKGWHTAVLPGRAVAGKSLQIYFDARDVEQKELATNGRTDSPSIITIRQGRAGNEDDDKAGDGEDPMKKIRDQQRDESYEASLHRRRGGSVWFGMGAGLGWGYVPAGKLEWEKNIKVSQLTTTTGLFHLLPEVGLMVSDRFALAAQGRIELIRQDQVQTKTTAAVPIVSGNPTTMAFAAFGRGIYYVDLAGGNFQVSFSGDVGGGYLRFPVKPVAVLAKGLNSSQNPYYDPNQTIVKTDTRPMGVFLVGASTGFIYHVHRRLAFALDLRVLTGLPDFGGAVEGNFSAQLAFGGSGPAPVVNETDEDNAPAPDQGPEPLPE